MKPAGRVPRCDNVSGMKVTGVMQGSRRRIASRVLATLVAMGVGWVGTPTQALANATPLASAGSSMPAAFFKKKKKKKKKKASKPKGEAPIAQPSLTPEEAETKREAIRSAVAEKRETDKVAAAESMESDAAILGDPVTMMEAGQLRLEAAKADKDAEQARASIETTTVALDILHYYDSVASGSAESEWLVIDPSSASGMIADAEKQVDEAESLIEELEKDDGKGTKRDKGEDKKKRNKKDRGKAKPGTGMIVAGSIFTVVGATGAALAIVGLAQSQKAQKDVEKLGGDPMNQPMIDELDEKGGRANRMAYIGLGLAVGGLAVGIPLLAVGVKKRKEAGPTSNALRIGPMMVGPTKGVVFTGRF
jgi:uncharacterized membrane protein